MQQLFLNQSDQRRESTPLTCEYWNHNKFDIIVDNLIDEQPMVPKLMKIMSNISDKNNEELESSIFMKVPNQNLVYDMNIDENLKQPFIQIQDHQSKADDPTTQTLQQRSKRIRKINIHTTVNNKQDSNQESDFCSSQKEELNSTPCKCTKSHCVKLYCQCFHQNRQCTELCKCFSCKNCDDHLPARQTALEKIKIKSQRQKHDDDLFDRTKVWGCKCQKSQCQKNYCECFIRNQKCSSSCKCKDCANKKRIPVQFNKKKKVESVSN